MPDGDAEGVGGSEPKEWLRVARSARGVSTVTVTLQEGVLSVKWSVLAHGNIPAGVADARSGARKALAELAAAVNG